VSSPLADAEWELFCEAHSLQSSYIVGIGSLEPRKNTKMLIRAYEALPSGVRAEHQLVLFGGGNWKGHIGREQGGGGRRPGEMIFLGRISGPEKARLLKSARLFVFPSSAEGFGLPILEAFAAGTAVICSDIPALEEVGGDGVERVNSSSEGDLTDAIGRLLTDSKRSTDLARRGANQLRRFDWKSSAAEMELVLRLCESIGGQSVD